MGEEIKLINPEMKGENQGGEKVSNQKEEESGKRGGRRRRMEDRQGDGHSWLVTVGNPDGSKRGQWIQRRKGCVSGQMWPRGSKPKMRIKREKPTVSDNGGERGESEGSKVMRSDWTIRTKKNKLAKIKLFSVRHFKPAGQGRGRGAKNRPLLSRRMKPSFRTPPKRGREKKFLAGKQYQAAAMKSSGGVLEGASRRPARVKIA